MGNEHIGTPWSYGSGEGGIIIQIMPSREVVSIRIHPEVTL